MLSSDVTRRWILEMEIRNIYIPLTCVLLCQKSYLLRNNKMAVVDFNGAGLASAVVMFKSH